MTWQPRQRQQEEPRQIAIGFRAKMRNFLDEKIRNGRNGIDMNMDKKGAPPVLLVRLHEMSEEVFELGCNIHEKHPEFDHKAWVHWMTDAEIDRFPDGIVIKHRSKFFCQQANDRLGDAIRDYYGTPVRFLPSRVIADRVEQ